MNYYRRYPGDYARDTSQLSMLEHGAYTLLLDYLYGTQRDLPGLALGLFRICKACTPEEKQAVRTIIEQYFFRTEKGFNHKRVIQEIKLAESRVKVCRENGKKGGRPKTQRVNSRFDSANPEHNLEKSSPTSNSKESRDFIFSQDTSSTAPVPTEKKNGWVDRDEERRKKTREAINRALAKNSYGLADRAVRDVPKSKPE